MVPGFVQEWVDPQSMAIFKRDNIDNSVDLGTAKLSNSNKPNLFSGNKHDQQVPVVEEKQRWFGPNNLGQLLPWSGNDTIFVWILCLEHVLIHCACGSYINMPYRCSPVRKKSYDAVRRLAMSSSVPNHRTGGNPRINLCFSPSPSLGV